MAITFRGQGSRLNKDTKKVIKLDSKINRHQAIVKELEVKTYL